MSELSKNARVAGFLYLLDVLVAPFRLIYIPNTLFVSGNAAETANNIRSHELLFRFGMVSDLFCGVLEISLVLALYRLLKQVNPKHAAAMVILGLMMTPIFFLNVLNDAAALILVHGANFLSVFDKPQRDALAMLFLRLHGQEILAAKIFWGLWLFPLARLVYRSRFLPRFLAIWLTINGFAYLALSLTGMLLPQYDAVVSNYAFPAQLGEVVFMLWLLVMGARVKSSGDLPSTPRHQSNDVK